jgi:hypothetical protein
MIGRFFPIVLGARAGKGTQMLPILTLVVLLIGGTVMPYDVANGGPSIVTSADVLNGGPSIAPMDVVKGGPS